MKLSTIAAKSYFRVSQRGSREEDELKFIERLVAVNFDSVTSEKGTRMFKVVPTIIREPVPETGAKSSNKFYFDEFGNKISSSCHFLGGATVYTPAQAQALMNR